MGTEIGLFDCFMHDPMSESDMILESDLGLANPEDGYTLDTKMDLLSTSLHENGLLDEQNNDTNNQAWASLDTDALLDSILSDNDMDGFDKINSNDLMDDDFNGNDGLNIGSGSSRLAFENAFSDDGSEDGGSYEMTQVMSPEPEIQTIPNNKPVRVQLVNSASTSTATTLSAAKAAIGSSLQRPTMAKFFTGIRSGTTILLPVLASKPTLPSLKRRRISDSSSDSGNSSIDPHTSDESSSVKSPRIVKSGSSVSGPLASGKYPPLILSEEEKRICERENIKLPSHYPLSREEEKNLKRIRRKIRNKVSAQDSRRRKKEYMDNMEERVKQCTAEKEELQKRIDQLETQNKTLAGQLRRLHQIIVNGGLKQNQTSTAMMVLLLSTALFLIPGFRDQHEGQKSEPSAQLDISRAIKMPPMPGQSRSLLQFTQIKQEFNDDEMQQPTVNNNGNPKVVMIANSLKAVKEEKEFTPVSSFSATADHDYVVGKNEDLPVKTKKKRSYIVEDVPPEGYGYGDEIKEESDTEKTQEEVYFFTDEEVVISEITTDDILMNDLDNHDRKLNVSVATAEGSGIRTIVLHVPKDIK